MLAWAASGGALAACGGGEVRVTDFGLHQQWKVERDCAHPERPPRLVEVPWREPAPRAARVPEVRAGMRVTVCGREGNAELRLEGTALSSGMAGGEIRVRAGLHGKALRAVVRGPGVVEIVSGAN